MYALIKREILDHIVYFIGAMLFSLILIGLLTAAGYSLERRGFDLYLGFATPVVIMLGIGLAAMGVSQMYTDKNRKVSAFLLALPVTRRSILAARVITGVLAILMVLVPVALTAVILSRLLGPSIPIFAEPITDIFTTVFLTALACYCVGLLTGWTTSKITPSFGGFGLTLVLVLMILVKGFGLQAQFLLVVIIAASLTRTWLKYMSTAL
jgi:hypothetical protein